MAGISFTTKDFVAKLREGHFASAPLSATGLVKLPDDEGVKAKGRETVITALQFAHGSDCSQWVTVPLTLIDRVDFLRVVRCKDHSHPLVTLIFSLPKTPEAQTFAAIANLASTASNPPLTRAVSVLGAPMAYHPVQHHPLLTTFNVASAVSADETVSPNPDGKCPDGYFWCGIGRGCCPNLV
jgi:hypothetical protein